MQKISATLIIFLTLLFSDSAVGSECMVYEVQKNPGIFLKHIGPSNTYVGKWEIHNDRNKSVYLGKIAIQEVPMFIGYNEISIDINKAQQNAGIGTTVLKFLYHNVVLNSLDQEYTYNPNTTGNRFEDKALLHKLKGVAANVGADNIGSIITQLRAGAVIFDYTSDNVPLENIWLGFPEPIGYIPKGNIEVIRKLKELCPAILEGGDRRNQAFKEWDRLTEWTNLGK